MLIIFSTLTFLCTSQAHADDKRYAYRHDTAGNMTSRNIVCQNRMTFNVDYQNAPTGEVPSIKANATWTDVRILFPGKVHEGDRLLIHTTNGLFVRAITITQAELRLDLSNLHRGAYLFTFSINGEMSNVKMNKRR